jgi:hypothetical protein
MKTIKVSAREKSLQALLRRASRENLVLRAPDGREFIVAELDDFDREIELTRQNKEFMRLLDERGREKATISAAEARARLDVAPERPRRKKLAS